MLNSKKRAVSLTPKQENALRLFAGLNRPSLEEWANVLGITYGSVIHYKGKLMLAGMLTYTPGRWRSYRLTETGKRYLEVHHG